MNKHENKNRIELKIKFKNIGLISIDNLEKESE